MFVDHVQGAARWAELAPLARLQQQLASCISVADLLLMKLRGCVGDKAVMTEMQVHPASNVPLSVSDLARDLLHFMTTAFDEPHIAIRHTFTPIMGALQVTQAL
jgi:hypothetical protein